MEKTTHSQQEGEPLSAAVSFEDGLGIRVLEDLAGERVERLLVRAELISLEPALRDRVSRLANFRHVRYPRVRGVESSGQGPQKSVSVVADLVDGIRLSTVLDILAERHDVVLDINGALQVARELLPALAVLHDSRNVSHGAVGPERVVLNREGRIIVVDHVFGLALERLKYPRSRLWREFRIAMPPSAGLPQFDPHADIAQIALLVLALILGRSVATREFPDAIRTLLAEAHEPLGSGASRPMTASLRGWFERALPIESRKPFATALEAQIALESVITRELAYAPRPGSLRSFVEHLTKAGEVVSGSKASAGDGSESKTNARHQALKERHAPTRRRSGTGRSRGPSPEEVEAEEIRRLEAELQRLMDLEQQAANQAAPVAQALPVAQGTPVAQGFSPADLVVSAPEDAQAVAGSPPDGESGDEPVADALAVAQGTPVAQGFSPADRVVSTPEDAQAVAGSPPDSESDDELEQLTALVETFAEAPTTDLLVVQEDAVSAPEPVDTTGDVIEISLDDALDLLVAEAAASEVGTDAPLWVLDGASAAGGSEAAAAFEMEEEPAEAETTEFCGEGAVWLLLLPTPAEDTAAHDEGADTAAPDALGDDLTLPLPFDAEPEPLALEPRVESAFAAAVLARRQTSTAVDQVDDIAADLKRTQRLWPRRVPRQPATAVPLRRVKEPRKPAALGPGSVIAAALPSNASPVFSAMARYEAAGALVSRTEATAALAEVVAPAEWVAPVEPAQPFANAEMLAAGHAVEAAAVAQLDAAAPGDALTGALTPAADVTADWALQAETPVEADHALTEPAVVFDSAVAPVEGDVAAIESLPTAAEAGISQSEIGLVPTEAVAAGPAEVAWVSAEIASTPAAVMPAPAEMVAAEVATVDGLPEEPVVEPEGVVDDIARALAPVADVSPDSALHGVTPLDADDTAAEPSVIAVESAMAPVDTDARPVEASVEATEVAVAAEMVAAEVAAIDGLPEEPVVEPERVAADVALASVADVSPDSALHGVTPLDADDTAAEPSVIAVESAMAPVDTDARPVEASVEATEVAVAAEMVAAEVAAIDGLPEEPVVEPEGVVDDIARALAPVADVSPDSALHGVTPLDADDTAAEPAVEGGLAEAVPAATVAREKPKRRRKGRKSKTRVEPESEPLRPVAPWLRGVTGARQADAPAPQPTSLSDPVAPTSQVLPAWARRGREPLPVVPIGEGATTQPSPSDVAASARVTLAPVADPVTMAATAADPIERLARAHETALPGAPAAGGVPFEVPSVATAQVAAAGAVEESADTKAEAPSGAPSTRGKLLRFPAALSGRVNWRRTAAAAIVLLLIEGVALATAYWLVTPREMGFLTIQTSVAGVDVLVDGQKRGRTPAGFELPPGRHTIELKGFGTSKVLAVEITGNVQTTQSITWPKPASAGSLRVSSSPPGAHVVVDGEPAGPAPVTVGRLAVGTHTIVVQNESGSVEQTVRVRADELTEIDVPIYSGWLALFAPVEVRIFLQGRMVGTSLDGRILMPPGRHEVELVNTALGYRETRTVVVTPGRVTAVSVDAPRGTISFDAPDGTEVWVDGEQVGVTPLGEVSAAVGTRDVTFRNPQLGQRRVTVVVRVGAPSRASMLAPR